MNTEYNLHRILVVIFYGPRHVQLCPYMYWLYAEYNLVYAYVVMTTQAYDAYTTYTQKENAYA